MFAQSSVDSSGSWMLGAQTNKALQRVVPQQGGAMSHEEEDVDMDVDDPKKRQNADKTLTSQRRHPKETREEQR